MSMDKFCADRPVVENDDTPDLPAENKDGTAPLPNENAPEEPSTPPFMPVLHRRAKEGGLDPDKLLELAVTLSTTLQNKADMEEDRAENNKATARNRLAAHLKMLVFILGGGLVIFGASSELLDLSGIDLGFNLLPKWLLVVFVTIVPISSTVFGWHEISRLRASFIKHQQERTAFAEYQQEIVALRNDCPLIFDGKRQRKHRPTVDAVIAAHPATMRLFGQYRWVLVVISVAVTACLATIAIQAT